MTENAVEYGRNPRGTILTNIPAQEGKIAAPKNKTNHRKVETM
jgi:hypothetical protein